MSPTRFNRDQAIQGLKLAIEANRPFDVVVIGGGITGAGVALDAASRGLRTLLLERDDFASGTSSRSSKLVHGGLRYLQQGDIALVYEALAERQRLKNNAPHLVKVLPFLLPIFTKDGLFNRQIAWALGKAMWLYDLTGGARIGKLHQKLSSEEALTYMPTLPPERLAGAYLYYDASTDDARLTLAVLRAAVEDFDAIVINHAPVVGFTTADSSSRPSSKENGTTQINGVTVELDGERLEIGAKHVVNAAGVWADQVRGLEGDDSDGQGNTIHSIRPAKGVHIAVPWNKIRNEVAAVVPVREDRRSIFVVPWGDQTYIGTTDTDYDGPLDDPRCEEEDIEYLLDAINAFLTQPLTRHDVLGTWAGLRPLVRSTDAGRTADLSRRHHLGVDPDGLISINGGKLTTYRKMAEETVNLVVSRVDSKTKARLHTGCQTKAMPLFGARGYFEFLREIPSLVVTLAEQDVASSTSEREAILSHLANRYGGRSRVLVAMIQAEPALATLLAPGYPFIEAEVLYAVRYEMALTLETVLTRRVPLRLHDTQAAAAATERVAAIMASELDWSNDVRSTAVTRFQEILASERAGAGLSQ